MTITNGNIDLLEGPIGTINDLSTLNGLIQDINQSFDDFADGNFTDPTITGGTIDGAAIGGSNPDSGAFTTLDASGVTTLGDDLSVDGDAVATGTVEGTALALTGQATIKVATILLTAAELGGGETNTSFSFPANGAILLNAWLDVTDAEAAATVDVGTQGTSNDPNGIMEAADLSTLGYAPTVAGALLGKFITGSDPVSVTASGDLNSCTATLYIYYIELP